MPSQSLVDEALANLSENDPELVAILESIEAMYESVPEDDVRPSQPEKAPEHAITREAMQRLRMMR
jgi:hypothetical protein